MKAKEITALVRYYDMAMCNLQNELNAANASFTNMANCADLARKEAAALKGKVAETNSIRDERDAIYLKYDKLEQLHTEAVAGFKSDVEILQTELDVAKKDARSAKQETVFFRHALSSLSCVTVDAVAHCSGENEEALRTFIGLVKEHATLSIRDRADLDAMLSNLDHDF